MKNFESNKLNIKSNLFIEVPDEGTIYFNSKIFDENLLKYKSIKNWNKIDIAKTKTNKDK